MGGDKKKSEKVAKPNEEKCLTFFIDRYKIHRRCQRKRGHRGAHSA